MKANAENQELEKLYKRAIKQRLMREYVALSIILILAALAVLFYLELTKGTISGCPRIL